MVNDSLFVEFGLRRAKNYFNGIHLVVDAGVSLGLDHLEI